MTTNDRQLATAIVAVSFVAALVVPRFFRSTTTRLGAALGKVLQAPGIMAVGTGLAFATVMGKALGVQGAILGATLTQMVIWAGLALEATTRATSVMERARRSHACFCAALGLLALGAVRFFLTPERALLGSNGAMSAIVVAALTLVVVWALDTRTLHRVLGWGRDAKLVAETGPLRADETIVLGLGEERWIVEERPGSPYRDGRTASLLIVGRLLEVLRELVWIVTGRALAVFAALLALHAALRPDPWPSPTITITSNPPLPPPEPVIASPPKAEPTDVRTWLSWYPQPAPIIEDLDDDGVEDIVGLRWNSGHEAAALSVVATNGKTFKPLWSIPSVPAQWYSRATHLARSGGTLFFTDGEESLRVIDLRTGAIRATVPTARAESLCAATEGAERVYLVHERFGEREEGVFVDAEGRVEKGKRPAWCTWSWERARCPRKDGAPCSPAAWPSFLTKVASYANPLEEGDVGVATAGLKYPKKDAPANIDVLFGYDPKTTMKRWESPIPFDDEALHPSPSLSHTMRAGRFFAYYQLRSGKWVLGARDGRTGNVLWSESPPRAEHGTHFGSMTATGARLYLALDSRLEVFDAATGASVGVVW